MIKFGTSYRLTLASVALLSAIAILGLTTAHAQTPDPTTMPAADSSASPVNPTAPVDTIPNAAAPPINPDANAPPTADPAVSAPVAEQIPVELRILKRVEEELKEKFKADIYTPANIPSLIFSPTQQSLLNSARQGLTTIGTGVEGLEEEIGAQGTLTAAPSVTSIFLSGIVFNGKDNWTLWLNGARITPKTLPKEIIDINVNQEFVELKWFDAATNQIFPVRLRPNQKFDFEQKTFLPGQ